MNATSITTTPPLRILKIDEVLEMTSISRATHFAKLNAKSKSYDPDYPKPLKLGPRSVGYVEQEVIDWLQARMEARL
ncbi:MAG: AlpA family phage regulatory protein [Marinobacter sp.]|nr:AlpA family phage regulatory protein [Marinobacter sp.]